MADIDDYEAMRAESDAIAFATREAQGEIRSLFAAYWAGAPVRLPYARGAGGVEHQPAYEAIRDALYDGAPAAALVALLQGRGSVEALREALVEDYAQRNADVIGSERAEPVPRFLKEAA